MRNNGLQCFALFSSREGEERVDVWCAYEGGGGLSVVERLEGPLARWCFEESPHVVELRVDESALPVLLAYLELGDAALLPRFFALEYAEVDALQRIRDLLRRLCVPYAVVEATPAR